MRQYLLFFAITILLLTNDTYGQDIHFSDYRHATNFFNPAMTGDFLGHIKIQGIARTQYARNYETGMIGGQLNIFSPLNNRHWIGIGTNLLFDQSGTLDLRAIGGELSLGYHIPIGSSYNNIISLGGGVSGYNLTVNTDNYRSEQKILGLSDPDLNSLNGLNPLLVSYQAGVYFKSILSKKQILKMGISATHINNPEFKVFGSDINPTFGRRVNVLLLYDVRVAQKISIEPGIFYSYSEKQDNTNIQLLAGWHLPKDNLGKVVMGVTHRLMESVGLIAGFQTEDYRFSLSFDILSGISSDLLRNPGAIELGGYYIFKNSNKPKIIPIVICPRL